MSNKKILVSGCGLTFGSETIKSWPKILQAVGVPIVNLSAPAVSNQWIVDRTSEHLLLNNDIDTVILQLTAVNKLDVEVTDERMTELVTSDTLRNFTWQHIWPSSASSEHISKELYYKYLYSPSLITKELSVKLALLSYWCEQHNIKLYVFEGYTIPWTTEDLELLGDIIQNKHTTWYQEYKNSEFYKLHDCSNSNTVPCIEYFFFLATTLATRLDLAELPKLLKLAAAYNHTNLK